MPVSNKIKKFNNIVIALIGNQSELYEDEQVTNSEGLAFAEEINAIFKTVSAKTGEGIDELFKNIGERFLIKINHEIIDYRTINHPKKEPNFDNKLSKYLNY